MILNLGKPGGRAWRRRLCSGVTLLAYLVTAIGAPVPEAHGDGPNACGQQVCCCGTPEQCQASGCGCPHRAKTPTPDEAPAEDEAPPSCCSHDSKKPAVKSSCCVGEPPAPSSEKPKEPSKSKPNTVRWQIGMSAQKCGGGATTWLNAAPALPMQTPLSWQPSWPYCHSLPITHEYSFVLSTDLLDPPPRFLAV
jgi:hypothetical protein